MILFKIIVDGTELALRFQLETPNLGVPDWKFQVIVTHDGSDFVMTTH